MDLENYPGPNEYDALAGWDTINKAIDRDIRLSLLMAFPGATYDTGSIYKISPA